MRCGFIRCALRQGTNRSLFQRLGFCVREGDARYQMRRHKEEARFGDTSALLLVTLALLLGADVAGDVAEIRNSGRCPAFRSSIAYLGAASAVCKHLILPAPAP